MATDKRVMELFAEELADRAKSQFNKVLDGWVKEDMDFFFPGDENTVDLCALAVLDRALAEDGATVPKKVRKNLAVLINGSSNAKKSALIIALTTLQPTKKATVKAITRQP